MHTVNSCCCGCSLKTGTLIFLYIPLIGAILEIRNLRRIRDNHAEILTTDIITIFIALAGIYGSMQKKPLFLIPFMAVNLLGIVAILISMLALLVYGDVFMDVFIDASYVENGHFRKKDNESAQIIFIVEVILGFAVALEYYCFIVVLSFFKKLRSGSQSSNHQVDQVTAESSNHKPDQVTTQSSNHKDDHVSGVACCLCTLNILQCLRCLLSLAE